MRFIFKANGHASADTFASRDAAYAADLLCSGSVIVGSSLQQQEI